MNEWAKSTLRLITRFVLAVVWVGILCFGPILCMEPDSGEVAKASASQMQNPTPENEKALADARHSVRARMNVVRTVWVFAVIGLAVGVYLLRPPKTTAVNSNDGKV